MRSSLKFALNSIDEKGSSLRKHIRDRPILGRGWLQLRGLLGVSAISVTTVNVRSWRILLKKSLNRSFWGRGGRIPEKTANPVGLVVLGLAVLRSKMVCGS